MDRSPGVVLIVLGVGAVLVGLLVLVGALSWFGNLPGDIHIERDSGRVDIPIVSGLVLSVVLSVVVNVVLRILR